MNNKKRSSFLRQTGGAVMITAALFFWQISSAEAVPRSQIREYDFAVGLYNNHIYNAAVEQFKKYISNYPENELTDDARFWLAETYYALERYEESASAYREYLDHSPTGELVERALFGLGWSRYLRGDYAGARAAFAELCERFPGSSLWVAAKFQEGRSLFEAKRYEEARAAFRSILETHPETDLADNAAYYLALTYFESSKEKSNDVAVEAFSSFLSLYSSSPLVPNVYYLLAETRYERGEYEQAVTNYTLCLEKEGNQQEEAGLTDDALYGRGWSYSKLEKEKEAVADFSRLAEDFQQSPYRPESLSYLAESALKKEDYAGAARRFQALVDDYPKTKWEATGLYGLGRLRLNQGRNAEALSLFQQIRQHPSGALAPESLYMIGRAYQREEKSVEAAAAFADLVSRYPNSELADDALAERALILANTGDYANAILVWKSLLQQYPASLLVPEAAFRIGENLFNLKDYGQALAAYQETAERYPDSRWGQSALYGVGSIHYNQEQYKRAADAYRAFLARYPDSELVPDAQYWLGWSYYRAESYAEAIAAFERVLTLPLENRHPLAAFRIGEAYYNLGQYKKAIEWYERTAQDYPQSSVADDAIFSLSMALEQDERSTQSIVESLKSISKKFPDSPIRDAAAYQVGEVLLARNEYSEAAEAYRRMVNEYPESDLRDEALYKAGYALEQAEKYTEAAAVYAALSDSFPQDPMAPQALLAEGILYQERLAQPEEAMTLFQRVRAKYPEAELAAEEALYREGVILLEKNDLEKARAAFKDVIEKKGSFAASSYVGLGLCETEAKNYEAAITNFNTAYDLAEDPRVAASAQFGIGQARLSAKNYAVAFTEFQKVYILFPESNTAPLAMLKAAYALEEQGKKKEALELYRQIIDKFSQQEEAALAQERVTALSVPEGGDQE